MSIWGKIIGGVAGFAVGGPIGALLGAAAGHMLDARKAGDAEKPLEQSRTKQVAFTVAVVALAAKMAKADGRVTRDEVDAFKTLFRIPQSEMRAVGALFDQAKKSADGFEPYARQVAELFHDSPQVLEELLDALFMIATADGALHPNERAFLERVAGIFGLERDFERVHQSHRSSDEADPYAVLGVDRQASDDDIRKAWKALIRENHPDVLTAKGMPPEFVEVANRKMAAINAAYDRIAKDRGFK